MNKFLLNPESVFNSLPYGFSHALVTKGGQRVFLSGQVGVDSDENIVGSDLASQTNAALDNIKKVLATIVGKLSHITILRLYNLESERDNQDVIREALLKHFPANPPATSWIFISSLSLPEWLIEIEAEALLS